LIRRNAVIASEAIMALISIVEDSMALKVVLLHVAGDARYSARLALALTLAKSHGALLRAVAALPPSSCPRLMAASFPLN
jgi:hypothetical protein